MNQRFMHSNPNLRNLFPLLPASTMAKARPKEKNPVCEESNISLEVSLSLGSTYMVATSTDKEKEIYYERNFQVGDGNCIDDQYQRKEHKMENLGEKKSEGVSSELSDVSRELSLRGIYSTSTGKSPTTDRGNRRSFEVGECSNQYQREEHNLNIPLNPKGGGLSFGNANFTSKKRERMENPSHTSKPSSRRNKRIKAEKQERCNEVDTELRLGPDPWCIKKRLFESDLGDMSRLMLAKELVESHIFPSWNADQLARIREGLPVCIWDCDTKTEYDMTFKRWNKGANVLIKSWKSNFVERRQLMAGDEIGLFWDNFSSRFKFSVLNRAARH